MNRATHHTLHLFSHSAPPGSSAGVQPAAPPGAADCSLLTMAPDRRGHERVEVVVSTGACDLPGLSNQSCGRDRHRTLLDGAGAESEWQFVAGAVARVIRLGKCRRGS